MLNKELMLNSKPYEPHILLTVDENESYEYGYIYQDLGSVNRRPYWVIDEVRYHLFELYYDESFYNVTGLSFDPFPAPKMYLRITINGASHTFNIGYPFEDGANGDFFDLKSKVGKTIPVTFDPPPTDTSIHNSHEASMEESVDAQQGINNGGKCESIGERYYTVSGIKSISSITGQERRHIRDLLCRRNCRRFQQNCEFKCSCRNKSTSDSFWNPYKRASTDATLDTHRSTSKTSIDPRYSRSRSLYRNRNRLVISEEALYT